MLTIDLSQRVAAVTGAGTGLGLAIARELAQAGAQVAVLEIDPASGPAAAEELRALGVTANAYVVDVADRSSVDDGFASVRRDFGRLDVVVNNAGISRVG